MKCQLTAPSFRLVALNHASKVRGSRRSMKLQQLRYLAAVAQSDLNLTVAASRVHTTQPAISKQLKLLEDELGFELFVRKGRSLTRVTRAGEEVLTRALQMLREIQGIKGLSDDIKNAKQGSLSIGTTHTQARYVLPQVIQTFRSRHPDVNVHLYQGTSEQIAQMAALDRIDLAIDSGLRGLLQHYTLLPCYHWRLCVVVPPDHELTRIEQLSLTDLIDYPLVTYEFGPADHAAALPHAFAAAGLKPNVVLTAWDSEVIKTYVRLGMGVGVVAELAVEPQMDRDLVYLDVGDLFPPNTTWVGFARGGVMRRFAYNFLSLLAPHLTTPFVTRAAACADQGEVDELCQDVQLEPWQSADVGRRRSSPKPAAAPPSAVVSA
jgi:LysR family transcriptional regulator, cys regulon transcriptional activator